MHDWGFLILAAITLVAGAVEGNKNRKAQKKLAAEANRVQAPPMERSEDGPQVQLGTRDNELTPSGGAGSAVAATQRINQIGQLGGPDG